MTKLSHADFSQYMLSAEKTLNQNKNLLEFQIPKNDPNWHKFRSLGFGASESGTLMECNPYEILPVLIEKKIGLRSSEIPMNEAMLSGLLAEDAILKRWRYHDGTDLNYIENLMNNKLIRECTPVSSYIVNKKYPRLFVSLDAKALPNQSHLSGKKVPYSWPIECKTISQFESKKWYEGIPSMYRFQIQTQMLVTETDYAELATLEDGRKFVVHPFLKDANMQEMILQKAEETWALGQKLLEMKQEMDYYYKAGNHPKAEEVRANYESIMPLPGEEEAFKEYYSDKMFMERNSFLGETTDFKLCVSRAKMAEGIKLLEAEKQQIENLLMRKFVINQGEYMDFLKQGKLRYYKKEGGKNFQFNFLGVKTNIDKESIEKEIKKFIG